MLINSTTLLIFSDITKSTFKTIASGDKEIAYVKSTISLIDGIYPVSYTHLTLPTKLEV